MKEIKAHNIQFNYYPLASEECSAALYSLGFDSFKIIGYTGAHSADIYFFGSDEDKFKIELLDNIIIGQYRKFYFSKSYSSFGSANLYYNVSYSKIK